MGGGPGLGGAAPFRLWGSQAAPASLRSAACVSFVPSQPAITPITAPAGQVQGQTGDQENENDAAQQAQLAAQAKITEAEAVAAVQAAHPGSAVTVKEPDGEGDKVIYDLKVQPADGGKAFEAAVDAVTGELLAAEADD